MDPIIDPILAALGLELPHLLALLALVSLICRLLGMIIPDDATGWRAVVRKVAKVVGLYVGNRITAGVSVNDVSRVMLETKVPLKDAETGRFTGTTVAEAARDKQTIGKPLFGDSYRGANKE